MDFKEITLTKKQFEELEEKEKRLNIVQDNLQTMIDLLGKQQIYIRYERHHTDPNKDKLGTKEVKQVTVGRELNKINILLKF